MNAFLMSATIVDFVSAASLTISMVIEAYVCSIEITYWRWLTRTQSLVLIHFLQNILINTFSFTFKKNTIESDIIEI